jgi:hypothetical protein
MKSKLFMSFFALVLVFTVASASGYAQCCGSKASSARGAVKVDEDKSKCSSECKTGMMEESKAFSYVYNGTPREQNITTTERSELAMSNHNDSYTTVTISVKTSWLGPLYQLLADLSNERPVPPVTTTDVTSQPSEPRKSYLKLSKLPSLVARYCDCGKCHQRLQGNNRSPWRTTYVGLYRASDGKEYLPCKSMLEAIRKGAPGSLVGFLYTPEKVIDNWRDRVDRTKCESIEPATDTRVPSGRIFSK